MKSYSCFRHYLFIILHVNYFLFHHSINSILLLKTFILLFLPQPVILDKVHSQLILQFILIHFKMCPPDMHCNQKWWQSFQKCEELILGERSYLWNLNYSFPCYLPLFSQNFSCYNLFSQLYWVIHVSWFRNHVWNN